MNQKVRGLKIFTYIFILIQMAGIVVFSIFYFQGLYNIRDLLKPEYIIAGALGLMVIDIILMWIFVSSVLKVKYHTDLRAAEVIGEDVQEAYNFAMIGLAVTDEHDVVVWTNDLFKERHLDIIDTNILEWQPSLMELKEKNNEEAVMKLKINNRNFEVKFLSEAGLWIFKDNTDYESIYTYSKQQAPVLGILSIDNYEEVVKGDEDYNDTITKVKNVIFEYAKEFDILLRRFKDNTYSMLCNFESYSRMKEDNFSIIDKVREVSAGESIPATLSIGLARDFPDVVRLNELAAASLSIAMSRGGDQVVVSVYGGEMEFYGGKTEAQEKRNRVRIRVLADSLINLIKNASNVLVMGHTNMDMDALGSCLGIKAICERVEIPAKLVVDLKNTENKTRAALLSTFNKDELEELVVSSKEAMSLVTPSTLIVVVDVHTPSMVMAPNLLDKSDRIVVIDHHRRTEEYIESPVFDYIDPSASSASELVTEFIKFASISPRIEIPAVYATIMLSGIFLDSEFYKNNNTGIRTFESSTILKEYGANNSMADDLLKDDYEEYVEVNSIVKNMKTAEYGVVYCMADTNNIYDSATIAKAANTCLSMKGVHACFAIGKISNKEMKVSARSDGLINVSLLCEKMGGGGHFTSAATVFNTNDIKEVEATILRVVSTYLKDAKVDANKLGKEGY